MKINGKGQVTIPAELRHRFGFAEGDEVDVVEDGDALRILHRSSASSRGEQAVSRLRGKASTPHQTDKLMELLRSE